MLNNRNVQKRFSEVRHPQRANVTAEEPTRLTPQISAPSGVRFFRSDRPRSAAPRFNQVKTNPKFVTAPAVLVVEDDVEMRTMLVTVLRKTGYQVQECKNGWEFLGYVEHFINPTPSHQHLDLIISDIRMPGLTGLEILGAADLSPEFPPVILITAFGDEQTHAEALHMGAIAVFDKPFEIDALLQKVRHVVRWPQ